MTYEEAQPAAVFSVVEALCFVLVRYCNVPQDLLEEEVERYARMHDDGQRQPADPEVGKAMRFLIKSSTRNIKRL